jgi:hypothetical protein
MWGTGYNVNGEIGDGTNIRKNTFQRIGSSYHWISVACGLNHSAALYNVNIKPVLSTNTVTSITSSSAIGGGTITDDGSLTITAKGVIWSQSPSPTISLTTKTNELIAGNSFTSNIIGLTNNTLYYIRAYATNSLGTSYGSEITFTAIDGDSDSDGIIDIIENLAPNGGDGNGDNVLDFNQNNITTVQTSSGDFITIESLGGSAITEARAILSNDNLFYYPLGVVDFKTSASSATIRMYFHTNKNLDNHSFRKSNLSGVYSNYSSTISKHYVGNILTQTVTFLITDGGSDDADGLVNGSIHDPSGLAILAADANIPVWDLKHLFLLLSLFGFTIYKLRKVM